MSVSLNMSYESHDLHQLAQITPSNTSATTLVAVANTERLVVTSIIAANVTATDTTVSIFHDVDGTTYNSSTALFYQVSLPANTTLEISSPIPVLSSAGGLGVQSGTGNAVTFTAYGLKKGR